MNMEKEASKMCEDSAEERIDSLEKKMKHLQNEVKEDHDGK